MTPRTVIRFGGFCLAGGAVAFLGVFAYLVARFISCGTSVEFAVREGTTFHFDYWGP